MFFLYYFCHNVMSVSCSLVATAWVRANVLALLYAMVLGFFCHFPIWCLGSVVVLDCVDS